VSVTRVQVISVIGIDPGETAGFSFIDYIGDALAGSMQVQVDNASSVALLETILARHYSDPEVIVQRWAQVEDFIVSNRPGTKGDTAEVIRQQVTVLAETLQMYGYSVTRRKKADVSPWATDRMLRAAGLLREVTGMRHANDASRHALYRAVRDARKPNPLR
jgi:hypothetical protein